MKSRAIAGAACVAACLLAPVSADAQSIPVGGVTQDEIAAWMRAHGAPITINSMTQSDPAILNTYIATSSNGLNYIILFFDCKAARCQTLSIASGVRPCTLTLDQINQWNLDRRFLRAAYKSDEQLCVAQMDVAAVGSSYDTLGMMFATWEHLLVEYIHFANTGALVARNGNWRDGRAVLPGLVIGKTTYADVLSTNGQPQSDEKIAEGGHVVRYPFEALRAHESGAIVSPLVGRDSAGSLAVLTFDAAGILQAYGAAAEPGNVEIGPHAFGTYNGLDVSVDKRILNNACSADCK